jgi:2-dehydro-3-deoxygalactonokinase
MGAMKFLGCDWGSSSFRLRLVSAADLAVEAQVRSNTGATVLAARLGPDAAAGDREAAFRSYLLEMIAALEEQCGASLAGLPVVVSGMATSAHGWRELPYARLPFPVGGEALVTSDVALDDGTPGGRRVLLLSGLRSDDDVMRGEETELIGLFRHPEWSALRSGCVVLLPGTHSKHVRVDDGCVVGFRTYMSGELYVLLARHSVLRRSLSGDGDVSVPEPGGAFLAGVRAGREKGLSGALFQVRVGGLFGRRSKTQSAQYLSGVIVGDEVAALLAEPPGGPVALSASAEMQVLYGAAFGELGGGDRLRTVPAETAGLLSVAGHAAALGQRQWGRQ